MQRDTRVGERQRAGLGAVLIVIGRLYQKLLMHGPAEAPS
jgi:uncharacterized membrane protein